MDAGRCRQCGRSFTSGEVTGVGILRPRLAGDGGPIVEFACPACRTLHLLIPHGHGRFAPPGTPPPPPPSDEERRVPWRRAAAASPATAPNCAPRRDPASSGPARPAATASASSASAGVAADPAPSPPPTTARPAATNEPAGEPRENAIPRDVADALEVLGLGIHASGKDVERAFRRLALTCHPDKVAHLDADFVALAERKFKRLQAARDLLLGA